MVRVDNAEMFDSDEVPPGVDDDYVPFDGLTLSLVVEPGDVIPVDVLGLLVSTGAWSGEHALAHVEGLVVPSHRGKALVSLAAHLAAELLRRALDIALTLGWSGSRAAALVELGPRLPETLLAEAWAAAATIPGPISRASALTGLVPHLPAAERAPGLRDAMTAARAITRGRARARMLTRLTAYLSDEQRRAVLREALTAASTEHFDDLRRLALDDMFRSVPDYLLAEEFATTTATLNAHDRVELLCEFVARLPPELLAQAWAEVTALPHHDASAKAMATLAPYLPADQRALAVQDAFVAATAISRPRTRAAALARLAGHLPVEQQAAAYIQAMTAANQCADTLDGSLSQAETLRRIVPCLPDDLRVTALDQALAAAVTVRPENMRIVTLVQLAFQLPPLQLTEALSAIIDTEVEQWRAVGLGLLAPRLPADLLATAATATSAITDPYCQAYATARLAPHLPEDQRIQAVKALAIIADHDS
jgi:hypothetical protein